MLKKTLALALAALFALSAFAFAEEDAGMDLVLGTGNRAYIAGEESAALTDVPIADILAMEDGFAVYATEQESAEDADTEYALYLMRFVSEDTEDGEGYPTEEITPAAECAVWDKNNGVVYYVNSTDPKVLYSFDPESSESAVLVEADSDIVSLRLSSEGLLVTVGEAEKLYIPAIRQLADPVYDSRAQEIKVGDGFDALLDTQEVLRVRYGGESEAEEVAQGVIAYCVQNGIVHYIARDNGVFTLNSYVTDNKQSVFQTEYPEPILPVMTMSESDIYAYSASGIVYDFVIVMGYLAPLNEEPFELNAPGIEAYEDYVIVYDYSLNTEDQFICTLHNTGLKQGDEEDYEEEEIAPAPEPEPTAIPWEELTLQRGMRGDEVKELQTMLNDNGYDCGKADGIFGQGTENAVKLLQGDMGLEETGTATPSLRNKMKKGDIPEYEPYVDLHTNDTGIRVQRLQQRLRTLGYMTAPAGGHYYEQTTAAVKRFQEQNDYKVTGNITSTQMKALNKKSAAECTEYYELKKGDSSPMVKRLNKRLKKLGYLKGTADESYSKATVKAVKLFCTYNNLSKVQSSSCNAKLQKMIYAKDAPVYEEEPSPDPTPKPDKKAWRLPTKKELNAMYKWMKSSMSMDKDQAIPRIQSRLIELGYLTEEKATGEYDDAMAEAVYHFQSEVTGKQNAKGITGKPTLQALFEGVN